MYKLCNRLVLDAIHTCGVTRVKQCIVVPMATGMTMALFYLYLRQKRPNASHVIWPRIDQKTCLKAIHTAGFTPVIVENVLDGNQIVTDVSAIRDRISNLGAANVACLVSTTSCFAPRVPESVVAMAQLAKEFDIPHLVNNAYGLQSSKTCHMVNEAMRLGRVDAIVQSSDKNFMVPVGGAILASEDGSIVDEIAKTYAGRASGAPVLDLFITLLSMGKRGIQRLLAERKEMMAYLSIKMAEVASQFGERVLQTPGNPVRLPICCDFITFRVSFSLMSPVADLAGHVLGQHCCGWQVTQRDWSRPFPSLFVWRSCSGSKRYQRSLRDKI